MSLSSEFTGILTAAENSLHQLACQLEVPLSKLIVGANRSVPINGSSMLYGKELPWENNVCNHTTAT